MGNTPKLRFEGYKDAWEQRKLGEIATFINGRAYSQPELLSEGKYKVLRVGNFYTNDSWYYSDLELGEKYYANYGDLLYTWSATFGPHIWLGDKVIYHYHIWKVDLSEHLEKHFAVQLLEQDKANILSSKNGSTMVHITKEGMEDKDVIIPSDTSEQKQIGAFFGKLDNLITLHQRKCKALEAQKRFYQQNMFPQKGERTPWIRFEGFTGNWEQRKLLELLSQPITDGPHETPDLVAYGIPFISVDAIVDNKIDFSRKRGYITEEYDLLCRKKYAPQKDDVYLVKSGSTVGKVAIVDTDERFNIWSPLAAMRTNRDILLPKYLYHYLQREEMQEEVSEKSKGGTQPNLSMRILEQFVINLPSVDEQQRISECMDKIDTLLTLQRRKLEKLKNIKKSMLEKMFV